MNNISTLNTVNRIVGDRALAWSKDHCVGVATNKTVVLYEMNPADVLSKSTEISLKPQVYSNLVKSLKNAHVIHAT